MAPKGIGAFVGRGVSDRLLADVWAAATGESGREKRKEIHVSMEEELAECIVERRLARQPKKKRQDNPGTDVLLHTVDPGAELQAVLKRCPQWAAWFYGICPQLSSFATLFL